MDNNTAQKIKKKFDTLPEDLKHAVNAADLPGKVSRIAQKNSLLIDQSSDLYMEIFLAMLGLEPLSGFTKNIIKNVGVTPEKATSIAQDVNNDIFLPIRAILRQIQLPSEEEIPNTQRDQILHDIENPVATPERGAVPITDPSREIAAARISTESFVANKISNAAVSVEISMPVKNNPPAEKKYTTDPYREAIN